MQVRIEDVSPVEKKLIVEVPWSTVNDRLLEAYRELGKSVQLRGFRKGKVPRSVLEKMFGQRVRTEVMAQLIRESFLTATSKHQLQAVSEPVVHGDPQIVKGEPFAFEAIVEVKGEVEASDYRGMELKKRRFTITEEAVDRALANVQREHTELRPIEGRDTLATSDYVALAVKGTIGERAVEQPQLAVDLGDAEHEPLPGLVSALIGLPKGTVDHALSLTVPADYSDQELAGKKAELTITVLDAREKDVPAIDDELAKDTGEAETLEELRALLRKRLEERMGEEVQGELRDAALRELVKRNQIPIANSLVERAAQYKEQRFRAMFGLEEHDAAIDDELRAKLREGADDDVRGQLLIDAVARVEQVEVADAELEERVGKLAQRQGVVPGRLRAEMERDGRLDNLRYQLLHNKVLDYIIARSVVTEVDPESMDAQPHVHGEDCHHDHDHDRGEPPPKRSEKKQRKSAPPAAAEQAEGGKRK
jgi:trigger factor